MGEAHIFYAAPAECPKTAEFRGALEKRLSSDLSEGRFTRQYRIQIQHAAGAYEGTLAIDEHHTETQQRRLSSESCAELVDALAFLTAVAIQLDGSSRDSLATGFEADSTETPSQNPAEISETAPIASSDARIASSDARRNGHLPRLSAVVAGGVRGGVRPNLAATIDTYVSWTLATAHTRASLLTGVVYAPLARTDMDGGTASLGLAAGRLGACVSSEVGYGFGLGPCGGIEMGVLPAHGDVPDGQDGAPFWLAFEIALSSRWAPQRSALFVEMQVKGLIPVKKSRFYFDPQNVTIYEAGAVVAAGTLGAGVAFY